jgi:hypothetical protein
MIVQRLLFGFACFGLSIAASAQAPPGGEDPGRIPMRFVNGGTRADFLKELKAAVANHADKWYEKEFPSLITALEHEPPPPAGYSKPADKRSSEESIRAWIFDLRDTVEPMSYRDTGDAASHLVAAGTSAMDALVTALDDDTPVRQLAYEKGPGLAIVLRRSDLAMTCIERISGIDFWRGGHFHNIEQRASATENVHNWWKQAKGKSQAEGIRIQLGMWKQNTTLRNYSAVYEAGLLYILTQLEPPEKVIERLRELCVADTYGLNSPITEYMEQLDPQFLLRQVFERLAKKSVRDGDYYLLLKYGDKVVYKALSQRAAAKGSLDPGPWISGDQVRMAAQYGKNWAMPLVAAVLSKTEMTGCRSIGSGREQPFCDTDDAMAEFQRLTHKDFGYKPESPEEQRLAAIKAAREWWKSEGRMALAKTIAADHPSYTDGTDLRASEEEIAATAARIVGADDRVARATVASLGHVYAFRVQEALLARLNKETDAKERVIILQKLDQPVGWQLPQLARVYEKDLSIEARIAAGAALLRIINSSLTGLGACRLETLDAALETVRRVADKPPAELILPTIRILIQHGAAEDAARIAALAAREPASSDPAVVKYMEWLKTRGN